MSTKRAPRRRGPIDAETRDVLVEIVRSRGLSGAAEVAGCGASGITRALAGLDVEQATATCIRYAVNAWRAAEPSLVPAPPSLPVDPPHRMSSRMITPEPLRPGETLVTMRDRGRR